MVVAATSMQAFNSIRDTKYMNRSRARVLLFFSIYDCMCNHEISRLTGMPINAVTPRTNDLKNFGILEVTHEAEYLNPSTGKSRNVEYMRLRPGFDFDNVYYFLEVFAND